MDLRLSDDEMRELRKEIVKDVKKEQYKELIKAKNTYNIYFNSINANNFAGMRSSMNRMEYTIPANNTEHIKFCKYRFKNLSLPPCISVRDSNSIHLEVMGGLVMNSGLPIIDKQREDADNGGIFPTIVSGPNTPFSNAGSSRSLVDRRRAGSFVLTKNLRDTSGITKFFAVKNNGALVEVPNNNTGGLNIGTDCVGGLMAKTFSGAYSQGDGCWRYGLNPFGKTLTLDFVSDLELRLNINDETSTDAGGRNGNFTITCELEVELLPDFLADNNIL